MTCAGPAYVRYEAVRAEATGLRPGIFWLVNRLGRDGRLSAVDEEFRATTNAWYDAAYTTPRGVYERHPLAAAWFRRETTGWLCARLPGYLRILDHHGVGWRLAESDDPGRVVYRDVHQVVVVPHDGAS